MAYAAVIFDLFETLITEYDADWRPGQTTESRLGIPSETYSTVWRSWYQARMTTVVDYRDVLRDVCTRAGVPIGPGTAATIETLYAERLALKARPLLTVDLRVINLLMQLRNQGLKLGVLSNCAVEEVAGWPDSALAPLFDDVVFSYQVGSVKPDPRIYRRVCDGLGVAADRVIFVGDGGSDELAGARSAGMTAYCARWFLDQWPAEHRDRRADRRQGFPALLSPEDLLAEIKRSLPIRVDDPSGR